MIVNDCHCKVLPNLSNLFLKYIRQIVSKNERIYTIAYPVNAIADLQYNRELYNNNRLLRFASTVCLYRLLKTCAREREFVFMFIFVNPSLGFAFF